MEVDAWKFVCSEQKLGKWEFRSRECENEGLLFADDTTFGD